MPSNQNPPTNDAYKAVDRQDSTCMKTEVIGTTSAIKKTWWHVDLGGTRNLFGIRIQFKEYEPQYGLYSKHIWCNEKGMIYLNLYLFSWILMDYTRITVKF